MTGVHNMHRFFDGNRKGNDCSLYETVNRSYPFKGSTPIFIAVGTLKCLSLQLLKRLGFMVPQPMNDTKKIYEEYGDKLIVGVIPKELSPEARKKKVKAVAADFVEEFCQPGNLYHQFLRRKMLTPAYRREIYRLQD